MEGLRNPFAVRNGKIIMIEDLSASERGLKCQCRCPACDGDFIARMGSVKIHHFAHSKDACDEIIAYTSGLYRLVHQILSGGAEFHVPALVVSCQLPSNRLLNEDTIEQFVKIIDEDSTVYNKKVIAKGRSLSFDKSELFFDSKKHIQAIELSCKDRRMAIKIMPPDTVCKYATVTPHKDMATLVLDFSEDAEKIQVSKSEDFQQYLYSENLYKYWISNPLIKTLFPQLLEKNKSDYASYLEQQKKKEEERKKLEEKKIVEAPERQKQIEKDQKIAAEKQKQLIEKRKIEELERQERLPEEQKIAEQRKISEENEKYILAYESVRDKFTQQDKEIKDCYGNRWVQCKICGKIKPIEEHCMYGGSGETNLGKCYECMGIRRNNS